MDDPTYMNTETSKTGAIYWPAEGKLLARITLDGKFVAIFKASPTDEQGHAMAKAIVPADESKLPFPILETATPEQETYARGFNACLRLWKESLQ